ncbi:hypothetical protein Godav_011774 [Gossypium davidsonii]|uniref:DUF4283 domain-containing protein n=1 Tax=Gossypium davidsonii TaxID=34287 RepID=A0A7J8RBY6_GOSDV|nr:hypothetical protein [Gossypium davidsonii]
MESKLVGLTINDEEEEVLQFQFESQIGREAGVFQLVGCFLTTSIIHFPAMKSTMVNLWHPVRGVQIQYPGGKRSFLLVFFSERLAIQLGNFIAKMALGVEVAEMGWDLSSRAQSRRALAMNNVWLREEEEGVWGGNREGIQVLGYSVRGLRRNMGKIVI